MVNDLDFVVAKKRAYMPATRAARIFFLYELITSLYFRCCMRSLSRVFFSLISLSLSSVLAEFVVFYALHCANSPAIRIRNNPN